MSRSFPMRVRRTGAVAPFVAVMLVVLLGMLAFSTDLGYYTVVRTEAQSAADSASMAGAAKLFDREVISTRGVIGGFPLQDSADVQAAKQEARKFAALNKVGGLPADLHDSDIDVGYLANPYDHSRFNEQGEMEQGGWPARPYNAVRVRVRRDASHGGGLATAFGRLLGPEKLDVMATATAVFEVSSTYGFELYPGSPGKSKLLPFALRLEDWNALVASTAPGPVRLPSGRTITIYDDHTANPDIDGPAGVSDSPDNVREVKLYPQNRDLTPGNFGTVDIGGHNNSSSDLRRQILEGVNAADLAILGGEFSPGPDHPVNLNGETGFSGGIDDNHRSALEAITGQGRIIPLFDQVQYPGNNAEFRIVGFAGITIVDVRFQGSLHDRHIKIQPRFVFDPSAKVRPGDSFNNVYVSRGLELAR